MGRYIIYAWRKHQTGHTSCYTRGFPQTNQTNGVDFNCKIVGEEIVSVPQTGAFVLTVFLVMHVFFEMTGDILPLGIHVFQWVYMHLSY